MPKLPTYESSADLNTDRGGVPTVRPDAGTMMAANAVQNISADVQNIALRLNQRQEEKATQKSAVGLRQVDQDLKNLLDSDMENIEPDGSGLFESFQGKANKVLEGYYQSLSPDQQERFRDRANLITDEWLQKAATIEHEQSQNYAATQLTDSLNGHLVALKSSPQAIEDIRSAGLQDIEEIGATLSPADREAQQRAFYINTWLTAEEGKIASDPAYRAKYTAPTSVYGLVIREEGFRPDAYYDVNAYRTGYGSDTVTRADGTIEKVTKDTVVTKEDADRDLVRRVKEFEGTASGQVGGDQWAALPENVRSALISVTYNYGSLPSSVVTAAKGGDVNAIATAVESLSANPERRAREAAIIRGGPSPDIPEGITPAQYAALQSSAQRYDSADKKNRKETYDLAIVAGELTDPGMFMNDPYLDNGDKATLLRAFNTENGDRAAMAAIMGGAQVNSFDPDQRRAGDKLFNQLIEGATPEQIAAVSQDYVEQTGYIPEALRNELRNAVVSGDPVEIANAMGAADYYSEVAPKHFQNFEGHDGIQKDLDKFNAAIRLGYSRQQAAQQIVDGRDPEKRAARKGLLESDAIKKNVLDKITPDTVIDIIGDPWGLGNRPELGENPAAEAAITADYKAILEQSIIEANGDVEIGQEMAAEQFKRVYGTSSMNLSGDNIAMRYPPEVAYPPVNGGHDYIREQAYQALGEVFAMEAIATGDMPPSAEDVFLQPYEETEADIKAGQPARYRVLFQKDGRYQMYNEPFIADPDAAKIAPDLDASRLRRDMNQLQEEFRQGVISGTVTGSFQEWIKETHPDAVEKRKDAGPARPATPIGAGGENIPGVGDAMGVISGAVERGSILPAREPETESDRAARALEEEAFRAGNEAYRTTTGSRAQKMKAKREAIERIMKGGK